MRPILPALITAALAACSEPEPAIEPAPDAADRLAPLDGEWRVTWTCEHNCILPEPSLVYSRDLTIRSAELHWRDSLCVECVADDVGELAGECVNVAPQVNGGLEQLAAYSVCVDVDGTIGATLSATRIGGTGFASTWRASGRRL